ncbi:ATP-binding cassette domain-containing protein [Sedimentibacter sp. zth1]|uniref:ABC transporter ATP-binding protein n=1 Tax=Sedimentibacter sp. zth1 TaxID=2816908 RepID=UPI001A9390ED|nr:oligopeptide/dipeptide ABC transporter ATP-binding protein [Sedimentibacter sp. zth1]QSX05864.1 ATP-binding cassette domain-containing protein [Sedimentibacter sp. zth1]
MESRYLLEVKNISKKFTSNGRSVKAVDNISFEVYKGETFAIVGESGCGKSTTGRLILRLIDSDSGKIYFKGKNIVNMSKKDFRKIRPSMQIVFQDPYASLNPRMTVGKLIAEPVKINKKLDKLAVKQECERLIQSVGLEINDLKKYPHEFSGGQRQRIGIARAIATKPDLVVCDEPVSALDLLVQAQMLNLLKNIQKEFQFSYIFISHNLSVVKHMSDRIAVMYFGQIVEIGKTQEIFETPLHPYTRLLLNSALNIKPNNDIYNENENVIEYNNDRFSDDINCCKYINNCAYATEECLNLNNNLYKVSDTHYVSCRQYSSFK